MAVVLWIKLSDLNFGGERVGTVYGAQGSFLALCTGVTLMVLKEPCVMPGIESGLN